MIAVAHENEQMQCRLQYNCDRVRTSTQCTANRTRRSGFSPLSMPAPAQDSERNLAVFIDLENLALGSQHRSKGQFKIQKVLERLLEKGKLIVKKAYADWSRFPEYTSPSTNPPSS